MTEVREITFSDPIFARSAIRVSVMPSAKYSWSASPDRFSRGRTAIDRIGHVLEQLLAQILEGQLREPRRHLQPHDVRDADTARVRQPLEASGQVHSLAKQALPFDSYFAQMNAHAKAQPSVDRQIGIPRFKNALRLDGKLDRVGRVRKAGEKVIAHEVDEASPVLLQVKLDLFAVGVKRTDCRVLVLGDQPCVAHDVCRQNRQKPSFFAIRDHREGRSVPIERNRRRQPALRRLTPVEARRTLFEVPWSAAKRSPP